MSQPQPSAQNGPHYGVQVHPAGTPTSGAVVPVSAPAAVSAAPTSAPHPEPGVTGAGPSGGRRVGEPVGRQARWKTLYTHLETLALGELFTWEEMGQLLGLDFIHDRAAMSSPFKRAADELVKEHRRTVVSVRGIGWKVATPKDQLKQAHKHQKRALVEVNRGRQQVEAVDPAKLDPETRKAFEIVGTLFRHQATVMDQLDVRQQRLEKVLSAVQDGQRRTEHAVAVTQDTVQDLMARLAALEQQQRSPAPTP